MLIDMPESFCFCVPLFPPIFAKFRSTNDFWRAWKGMGHGIGMKWGRCFSWVGYAANAQHPRFHCDCLPWEPWASELAFGPGAVARPTLHAAGRRRRAFQGCDWAEKMGPWLLIWIVEWIWCDILHVFAWLMLCMFRANSLQGTVFFNVWLRLSSAVIELLKVSGKKHGATFKVPPLCNIGASYCIYSLQYSSVAMDNPPNL